MYISPEQFSNLPPEDQNALIREYVKNLSFEEQKILKIMIENELTASDDTGAV